jgi:hypothetical protein
VSSIRWAVHRRLGRSVREISPSADPVGTYRVRTTIVNPPARCGSA